MQTIYVHSSFKSNPLQTFDFSNTIKSKNTYLTSIYNIPKKKRNFYNISLSDVDSHLDNNPLFNSYNLTKYKSIEKEKKIKKKDNNEKIEKFMKEKYYEDVEKLTKHKLEKKNWFSNSSTQNKVIKIKKVIKFWEGLCDYSNPRFAKQRFKNSSEIFEKKNNTDIYKNNKKENDENKKLPILYTTHRL